MPSSAMVEAIIGTVALAAIITSIYALIEARRAKKYLLHLLKAASLQERLAKSLARVKEKPRKRYIVFRVETGRNIDEKDLAKAISEKFRVVLGEAGFTASGAHLVYYNPVLRAGVLRVRSDYKYPALAVLGMIREIGGERARIIPLGTSGTLRSALKRLKRTT
ncbi:MAG: Rpp14/Pop5 family protein [Desulfurococcales archaeon]|nr:Rpp14/Pop5 family protein [Desulfurococcales archaeon]